MGKRKRIIVITGLSMLMLFCFSMGVAASSTIEKVSAYLRHDFIVKLNGKAVTLGHPIIMYQGWSYIPLSDVAKLLNIDIRFDSNTKTMYINADVNRIDSNDHLDITGEEFTLTHWIGYEVAYLGKDYPVLADQDYQKKIEYLRLKDIQRMGIDVKGLPIVREKLTQQLYVRKSDLDSLWLDTPKFNYYSGIFVSGETDQDKINAIEMLPKQLAAISPAEYIQMLMIDAAADQNEYDCYGYQNGNFVKYHVQLKQSENTASTTPNDGWYINGYNTTVLKSNPSPNYRYPNY